MRVRPEPVSRRRVINSVRSLGGSRAPSHPATHHRVINSDRSLGGREHLVTLPPTTVSSTLIAAWAVESALSSCHPPPCHPEGGACSGPDCTTEFGAPTEGSTVPFMKPAIR